MKLIFVAAFGLGCSALACGEVGDDSSDTESDDRSESEDEESSGEDSQEEANSALAASDAGDGPLQVSRAAWDALQPVAEETCAAFDVEASIAVDEETEPATIEQLCQAMAAAVGPELDADLNPRVCVDMEIDVDDCVERFQATRDGCGVCQDKLLECVGADTQFTCEPVTRTVIPYSDTIDDEDSENNGLLERYCQAPWLMLQQCVDYVWYKELGNAEPIEE